VKCLRKTKIIIIPCTYVTQRSRRNNSKPSSSVF